MVRLHIKRGDNSQFQIEADLNSKIVDILANVVLIYNGRKKIYRICSEMENLALHGTMLPPQMQGLTDEQIDELHLKDEWGERCIPSGGFTFNKDVYGRRNGKQPTQQMQDLIKKTIDEAKELISEKLVLKDQCLTQKIIQQAISLLKGACMIVYPMKLPPHDVIQKEFENIEEIAGTQASLEVIEPALAQLWFSGKMMEPNHTLSDYLGRNDKCRVIVKLQKRGEGPPGREPVMSEEAKKQLMLHAYRKQEEWKKLAQDESDEYLDSAWADNQQMKRSLQGIRDVSWKPK